MINSANARFLAAKSAEVRRENKILREQARLAEEQARLAAEQAAASEKARLLTLPSDDYDARRLSRVREQLDRVDDMILHEDDPQRMDRLAAASARLSEQVRILSNKPLPGSYKPTGKPSKRQVPGDISPDLQS